MASEVRDVLAAALLRVDQAPVPADLYGAYADAALAALAAAGWVVVRRDDTAAVQRDHP